MADTALMLACRCRFESCLLDRIMMRRMDEGIRACDDGRARKTGRPLPVSYPRTTTESMGPFKGSDPGGWRSRSLRQRLRATNVWRTSSVGGVVQPIHIARSQRQVRGET
jgi:hypothetical protein